MERVTSARAARVSFPIALITIALITSMLVPGALAYAQAADSAAAGREVMELSLLEAIEMALEQNLGLQISRVSTAISREGVNRSRGFLDPVVTFNLPSNLSGNISPQASQIDGAVVSQTNDFRGGFNWNESLIWGTRYSVGWTASRSSTNSNFATVDPRYQSGLSFQITQPERQQQLGTAELLDLVQGEVRVTDEEVRLLQAELAVEEAEEELKRLINVDALGEGYWDAEIVPTDTPEYVLRPLDLEEAVETAFQRDPQLAQLRFDAETQSIQLNTARNDLLPTLDVSATIGVNGQGGNRIIRGGDLGGNETEIIEGGLTQSLANMFSGDFRNWSLGLTVCVT